MICSSNKRLKRIAPTRLLRKKHAPDHSSRGGVEICSYCSCTTKKNKGQQKPNTKHPSPSPHLKTKKHDINTTNQREHPPPLQKALWRTWAVDLDISPLLVRNRQKTRERQHAHHCRIDPFGFPRLHANQTQNARFGPQPQSRSTAPTTKCGLIFLEHPVLTAYGQPGGIIS